MNKKKKILSSKDRDGIVILAVIMAMILLTAFFYFGSRRLPLLWIAGAILLVEVCFTLPAVYKKYHELYNMPASMLRFVPLYNSVQLFPKIVAVMAVLCTVAMAATAIVAFGPPVFVTEKNAIGMMNLSYGAVSVLLMECVVFSVLLGAGYTAVMADVRQMRYELTNRKASMLELVYYVFMYVPFLRTFALFNLYTAMNVLLLNGFSVGRDYSRADIEECDDE